MAVYVSLHDRIYVGQLDLSGVADQVAFGPSTRVMVPVTTYNDGGFATVIPGQMSGEVTVSGFSDFAAGVLDDTINNTTLGTAFPVTVVPNPTGTVTAGDTAWLVKGRQVSYSPASGAKGDAARFSLNLTSDGAVVKGYVSHAKAARTSTGNGTSVALAGPSASQYLYSALHVTAWSGLTSLDVTIESDDDSGTFASATTRITHTQFTAIGSEWKSVIGSAGHAAENCHRLVYTIVGTGSVTLAASFGVI